MCLDIKFDMNEEEDVNYNVGNIHSHIPVNSKMDEMKIVNTNEKGVNSFRIDSQGNLLVTRKIDRDTLCPTPQATPFQPLYMDTNLSNPTNPCIIKIALSYGDSMTLISIEIKDINDNKPKWKKEKLKVSFTDGCKRRTKVAIPSAYDKDSGQNGQIDYVIREKNLPFQIINNDNNLYLETTLSLDREEKENYQLTIIAKDRGNPQLSSEIIVYIDIIDINDNEPIFDQRSFQSTSIKENTPVGTQIGQLLANDKDAGNNGKFHFQLSDNVPDIIRKYFQVTRDGKILINSPLDADRGLNSYTFPVVVIDEAIYAYRKSSETNIKIDIIDVNDEKPQLKVIFKRVNPQTHQPELSEDSNINTFVGILEASDLDFKGKDGLDCKSENSYFTLIQENRIFKYKIITQIQFDRETQKSVQLILSCRDIEGNIGIYNRSIQIKDENDNKPIFTKQFYIGKVYENSPIGTELSVIVKATDVDSDSVIRYSMMSNYGDNFTINEETGVIKTKVKFDREQCDTYTIKVLATDANLFLTPTKTHRINTGTGTVQVMILDENDNDPVFDQPIYSFHILEGGPSIGFTKVGKVHATDADDQYPQSRLSPSASPSSDNQHSSILYRLEGSNDSGKFRIDQRSGIITAITSLDRETKARYQFTVYAIDGNIKLGYSSPIRNRKRRRNHNTARTTVTVIVDDINDNSPRFIRPNASTSTVELPYPLTVGQRVTDVEAIDADAGDNSQIRYNITGGNQYYKKICDNREMLKFTEKEIVRYTKITKLGNIRDHLDHLLHLAEEIMNEIRIIPDDKLKSNEDHRIQIWRRHKQQAKYFNEAKQHIAEQYERVKQIQKSYGLWLKQALNVMNRISSLRDFLRRQEDRRMNIRTKIPQVLSHITVLMDKLSSNDSSFSPSYTDLDKLKQVAIDTERIKNILLYGENEDN